MEEWINIRNHPNYQISTHGRVRNKSTEKILKPSADKDGYLRLTLGSTNNVYIHRLVAENFYDKPNDDRNQVNHLDGNRQNNHVLNLEWCNARRNIQWGCTHGNIDPSIGLRAATLANLKKVRIVELNRIFNSVKECAEFLGVPPTNVSRCIGGSRQGQKLHGYHLEYI